MKWIRERTRKNEIIAEMAILSALVAALSAICAFFPWGMPILTFVAPVASVVIALTCPSKSLPIFVLVAFFVSSFTSFFDVQGLLFYLLPALILGAVYGYMLRKGYDFPSILFFSSLVSCALFFLSIPICKLIYGFSFYDVFASPILWGKSIYAPFIFPLFCLAYCFGQTLIAHLFVHIVFGKRIPLPTKDNPSPLFLQVGAIASLTAMLFFTRVYVGVSYFALGCLVYFSLASFLSIEHVTKPQIFLYVLAIFVSLLFFAVLYSLLPTGFGLLLLGIPFTLLLLINETYRALHKRPQGNKMEQQWHS